MSAFYSHSSYVNLYNIKRNVFVDIKYNEMSHNHPQWTLLTKIMDEIIKNAGCRKCHFRT
jgi:hypothetical protein